MRHGTAFPRATFIFDHVAAVKANRAVLIFLVLWFRTVSVLAHVGRMLVFCPARLPICLVPAHINCFAGVMPGVSGRIILIVAAAAVASIAGLGVVAVP